MRSAISRTIDDNSLVRVLAPRAACSVGAGERVENPPLRVGIEQRLRFVLAVQIDEQPTDFGEQPGVDRRAVDPRARRALARPRA